MRNLQTNYRHTHTKKSLFIFIVTLIFLALYNCSDTVDEIENSISGLQCVDLIQEIDEKYDREDRSCEEISADVDEILRTCNEFLDAEQKEQLEFYKANCAAAN